MRPLDVWHRLLDEEGTNPQCRTGPQIEGPKIMLYAIGIGMFTGFIFLTCLLFVLKDVNAVIESAAGPLLQILYDATSNKAGAVCLLMFPVVC